MSYLKSNLGEDHEDELKLDLIRVALEHCESDAIIHVGGHSLDVCIPRSNLKSGKQVCPNVCGQHSYK